MGSASPSTITSMQGSTRMYSRQASSKTWEPAPPNTVITSGRSALMRRAAANEALSCA